jgi:hypothetical protein
MSQVLLSVVVVRVLSVSGVDLVNIQWTRDIRNCCLLTFFKALLQLYFPKL